MKKLFYAIFFASIGLSGYACTSDEAVVENKTPQDTLTNTRDMKLKITVGSKTFTASLSDHNTTRAFVEMLPLTATMIELNGNEKYYDLPQSLPTNSSNPGTIQNGDLMLYGSRTLVLFYKSFSTSYSYTRLGKLDNPTGLASALGKGNITVTIEAE